MSMNVSIKIFGKKEDETVVSANRVSCDGGVLGHPKVYLSVDEKNITLCPYCSHKFLKQNKTTKIK